jgi:hypothetical protein
MKNDVEYRKLVKAFGLRFIITVEGQAGRFDFMTLAIKMGACIGLLGCVCLVFLSLLKQLILSIFMFFSKVSTVIADCVMTNCSKKRHLYQKLTILDAQYFDETDFKNTMLNNETSKTSVFQDT